MSFLDGQTSRASSTSSARGDRTTIPPDQVEKISQIEKSVTHLLVATKQLLEILTAWSRREATENNVSDVYVRLGYEFNIACRAFNGIGVETQDLGPVPDLLRNILEDTLSNEPSQASLEQYLPRIRDIIVNLLQGLKKKQQKLRQKSTRDVSGPSGTDSRQSSFASMSATEMTEERQAIKGPYSQRQQSTEIPPQASTTTPYKIPSSSIPSGRISPTRGDNSSMRRDGTPSGRGVQESTYSIPGPPSLPPNNYTQPSVQQTSVSKTPIAQSVPSRPNEPTPTIAEPNFPTSVSPDNFPKPQPRQQDALAALQRGGDLERRASRRFSAYQIQKHLGSNSSGIPLIPPAQHSPIPNRGRETKESMNATRMRGSPVSTASQARPDRSDSASPNRANGRDGAVSQAPSVMKIPTIEAQSDNAPLDSPMIKTPQDKLRPSYIDLSDLQSSSDTGSKEAKTVSPTPSSQPVSHAIRRGARNTVSRPDLAGELQDLPSTATKELVLFLQYKTKIKKIVLPEGYEDLSVARLQLAFIDKFAWNTHSNGVELPEIYIQDPISGVRYELEDLSDVKNNSVLVLNVDALDDVKLHIDDGLGGLKHLIEGVRTAVDNQQSVLRLVADKQQDAAKDIASFNAAPPSSIQDFSVSTASRIPLAKETTDRLREVQSLRRDLAVVRQTYTGLMSDMEASMSTLRVKASTVKAAAVNASLPTFDSSSGRGYVDAGRKALGDDSEKIINRVDDLQDVVEDLRKDVVSRGVRPLPRQLDSVSKEISTATTELKKLQEYIKREKPIWTKIWRSELELVYDDQKSLNMQEELAADLERDLSEAANTFALVEEATRQQNVESTQSTPTRSLSRTLNPVNADMDPQKAKDGVLGEVRALQPNHETRLEAIERAEKARQRELESRREGVFKKELGSFIEEGKLKKSGGVEEAERMRKSKDDRIRKEVWDRMNGTSTGSEVDGQAAPQLTGTSDDPFVVEDSPAKIPLPREELTGDVVPEAISLRSEHHSSDTPDADDFVEAVEQPASNDAK